MNMVKGFKLLVSFISVFLLTTGMFFTSTAYAHSREINFESVGCHFFGNASFRDNATRDLDSNSGIFFLIGSPTDSKCTLKIFYANGDNRNRGARVIVNGKTAKEVSFPPTGGWSNFSSVSVPITLTKFQNVIIFTGGSRISSYAPDIDRFTVIGEDIYKVIPVPPPPEFPITETEVEVEQPIDSRRTGRVVLPPPISETEVEVVPPIDSTVRTIQVTPPPVQVTQ